MNTQSNSNAGNGCPATTCSRSDLRDRFSWSRVKPTERAIPETLEEVILLLESRMEVHQDWLDWFKSGEAAEVQEAMKAGVGTIESQEYYIAQYRAAIALIRGENAIGEARREKTPPQ